MKSNRENLKKILLGLILLIVSAAVILLINRTIQDSETETPEIETDQLPENNFTRVKVLPVKNKMEESGLFKLTNPFYISAIVQYPNSDEFSCLDLTEECNIYHITDTSDTYFFSKNEIVQGFNYADTEKQDFNVNGKDLSLNIVKVEYFDEEDEVIPDKYAILQIYGCVNDNLCVSSGNLPTTPESKNKQKVESFISFLNTVEF